MRAAEGFRPALLKLVAVLDRFQIRFHLTGGVTSVAYGDPRMTEDLDLVVDRDRVRLVGDELLIALASAGFHLDQRTASRAIEDGKMFQVLDMESVIKIDLYVRCLIPGELDRSVAVELFPGVILPIAARTDVALSKLIWIQHGSHRSRRDLRGIVAEATSEELATMRRMAAELQLLDLLDRVLAEDDEIDV